MTYADDRMQEPGFLYLVLENLASSCADFRLFASDFGLCWIQTLGVVLEGVGGGGQAQVGRPANQRAELHSQERLFTVRDVTWSSGDVTLVGPEGRNLIVEGRDSSLGEHGVTLRDVT
eukprot:1225709-Rhodomonas_salina.1